MGWVNVWTRWRQRRHRGHEILVLVAMRGRNRNFGYPISRAASLRPGATYGALTRLLNTGAVRDGWEGDRRWYQLTDTGRVLADWLVAGAITTVAERRERSAR